MKKIIFRKCINLITFVLVVLFAELLVFSDTVSAGSFQNEPEGFRGINWGTDISTLTDMKYVKDVSKHIKAYTRNNDKQSIGPAELEIIQYIFWRGKFYMVDAISTGDLNWQYLKETCISRYGNTTNYGGGNADILKWEGEIATVGLFKVKNKPTGQLFIMSKDLSKQIKIEETSGIKQGADRDF